MNIKQTQALIEALLFAAGDVVQRREIARITGVDEETISLIIEKLSEEMNQREGGLQILQVGDGYQLSTRPEFFEYISKLVEPRQQNGLSNAALEALSIVAYNQPVTRASIEFIRGVNSDGALNRLIERGLVEECGRLDSPGKPLLYRTTAEFLRCFGLKSLDELPDINNIPLQIAFYGEKGSK